MPLSMANCLSLVPSRNHRITRTACLKQPRARRFLRVPRRNRSACSRPDSHNTVSSLMPSVALYVTLIVDAGPL
jgi:hypothetical protein